MLPTPARVLNAWTEARFRRRWERWRPWVILYRRQNRLPVEPTLSLAEENHRAFLLRVIAGRGSGGL